MRTKATLAALAVAAVVAACGGNDFQTPPASTSVPASASASVNGFIAYLKELVATVASFADTLEPVDTSMVTGPTDDTGDPQKVD